MSGPARPVERLSQAAIAKALRAARDAGLTVERFDVTASEVRVYARRPEGSAAPEDAAEAWLREHGAG